jgi:hypothetical protein
MINLSINTYDVCSASANLLPVLFPLVRMLEGVLCLIIGWPRLLIVYGVLCFYFSLHLFSNPFKNDVFIWYCCYSSKTRTFLEKLISVYVVTKLDIFCLIVLTRAPHWSLFWAIWTKFTFSYSFSYESRSHFQTCFSVVRFNYIVTCLTEDRSYYATRLSLLGNRSRIVPWIRSPARYCCVAW